jgi:hypothetical protein
VAVVHGRTAENNMKKFKNFILFPILCILFFCIGFGVVYLYRVWQKKSLQQDASPILSTQAAISPTPFIMAPPTEAVTGTVETLSGEVQKIAYNANDFLPISTNASILQGEVIKTLENGSAKITFPNTAQIDIRPISQIEFSNLLPQTMLFTQRGGAARYTLSDSSRPVSVRILHTLFTIASGSAELAIDSSDITLTVLSGETIPTIVDVNNDTKFWHITAGKTVTLDDENKSMWAGRRRLYPDN